MTRGKDLIDDALSAIVSSDAETMEAQELIELLAIRGLAVFRESQRGDQQLSQIDSEIADSLKRWELAMGLDYDA